MSKRSSTRPNRGQSANNPSTNGTTKSAQAQTNGKATTKTPQSELTTKTIAAETVTSTPPSKQAQPKEAPASQPSPKSTSTLEKSTTAPRSNKPPVKQAFSANRPLTKQAMKNERRLAGQQRRLQAQQRATRNKRIGIASVIVALLVVGGFTAYFVLNPPGRNAATSTAPVVEGTVVNANYPPIDGTYCDALEQSAYHIHVHLSMWIDGKAYSLPQGVGIAPDNSCLYWLHVHDTTGVIHIEAPQSLNPIFGDFVDIWDQSFHSSNYPIQLSSTVGWTVYVNGKKYNGDFHNIPLTAHTLISMMYNSPNAKPDTTYNWGGL